MKPGDRVRVTTGARRDREGVVVAPADAEGWVTVRLESATGWPFPDTTYVQRRHLKVLAKETGPPEDVGPAPM